MAKPAKRYLLPENPTPEDDKCLVIFYPDDPGYLRAILGSLEFLGTWTAWDFDEAHTALLCSARVKQSNLRTLQTMAAVDCELLTDMLEDGDMSIVINNNTSCGGCGGCNDCVSPTSTYSPLPEQPNPNETAPIADIPDHTDDGETPPAEFETYQDWLDYKCRVARTIALDTYDTLNNMATWSGLAGLGAAALAAYISSAAVVGGMVVGLLGVGLLSTGAIWIIIASLVAIVLAGTGLLFYINSLADRVLLNIDVLTCIIFNGPTKEAVKENVTAFFETELAAIAYDNTVEEGIFTISFLKIIDYLLPGDLFGLLNGTVEELDQYLTANDGFNCAICGDIGVLGAWAVTGTTGSNDPDLELHSVSQSAWQLSGTMNRGPINAEQINMATVGNVGFDFDDVFAVSFRSLTPITPAPTANQGVRWHPNGTNIEVPFQAGEGILMFKTGSRPAGIPAFENEFGVATHAELAPVMRLEWPGGSSPFTVAGSLVDLVLYDVNGDAIEA